MSMWIGYAKGKVSIRVMRTAPDEIVKYRQDIRSWLDAIKEKGWTFLYIEAKAWGVAEVDVENKPFRLFPTAWTPHTGTRAEARFVLDIDVSTWPEIKDVSEVEIFRINICTKSFPRSVSVDLSKGLITYVNEAFWNWESGWEKDPEKLSQALEVYEVIKWLIDEKKLTLSENYNLERYKETSKMLEGLVKK
ncbi:MAG: hypothetical protein QXO01_03345 [Nitrososphaerota archaeon]